MVDSIDILVKLFDTLKESSDESKRVVQTLVTQQQDLVSHIKTLPISDLKENLKEHSKQSIDDINTCTQKVEAKSDNIMGKLRGIDSKVTKMIIVMSVLFTLLAVSYFIVRHTIDKEQIEKDISTSIINEIEKRQATEHQEIINAVEKAIKKYHEEDRNVE
jgi:preprotein translocase subunit SecG